MTKYAITIVTLLAALFGHARIAGADEIAELVDRADRAYRGKTSAGVFDMDVVTDSYQRSYKVVAWDDSRGDRDRALIKILGPALWRGHGTLKVGDKLKLYNPKTNHVTVVGHSMLGDSWMGSHFSNDDLVKETRLSRDYVVKLERRWQGRSELGPSTLYRVRLTPRPTAPVAWGRIIYQLAEKGDTVIPMRAEYYRKPGQKAPSRVMTFTDLERLGGRQLPSVMKVTVADKPGEHTAIRYQKLALGVKIPDSKFTEQALRR